MESIEIKITTPERDLILNETFATPDLTDRINLVEIKGKNISVLYNLDELEDLLGFIAAEANHAENKRIQQRLDKLYEKLSKIQGKYL